MKYQAVILLSSTLALASVGCQEKSEQAVSLTQVQWEEVRSNLLTEAPKDLKKPMNAVFGDKVELLGVSLEPEAPRAGQEVKITWYWRALADMDKDYQIFVHLDHKGKTSMRQGLDHHPVRELYQTSRWEKGQIIRDVQTVTIQPNFPGGPAELWAGLWHPASNQRLALKADPKVTGDGSNRALAYQLEVKGRPGARGPAPKKERATYVVRPAKGPITIDGKLDEPDWDRAARTPRFGDTRGGAGKPGEAWAKVMYDEDFLYIAMHARDEDIWGTLKERDSDTWTQEVFEVFIDPDGDAKDYLELQVTPANTVFDARFPVKLGRGKGSRQEQIDAARAWNSHLVSAVHIEGTLNGLGDKDLGWTLEMKLPLSDIPGPKAVPGASWRANFYRFDLPRDSKGKPGRQIAWSWTPAHGFFHNVQHFGELRFVGQGAKWEPRRTLIPKPAQTRTPRAPRNLPGEVVAPDKPE